MLLTEFASRIGLAFQIIDDVLDVTQSTETLGKPAKSDVKAKKSTYTSLLGVEQARSQAQDLLSEALSLLKRVHISSIGCWKSWRRPSCCETTDPGGSVVLNQRHDPALFADRYLLQEGHAEQNVDGIAAGDDGGLHVVRGDAGHRDLVQGHEVRFRVALSRLHRTPLTAAIVDA